MRSPSERAATSGMISSAVSCLGTIEVYQALPLAALLNPPQIYDVRHFAIRRSCERMNHISKPHQCRRPTTHYSIASQPTPP
jgi:hypothetical protein